MAELTNHKYVGALRSYVREAEGRACAEEARRCDSQWDDTPYGCCDSWSGYQQNDLHQYAPGERPPTPDPAVPDVGGVEARPAAWVDPCPAGHVRGRGRPAHGGRPGGAAGQGSGQNGRGSRGGRGGGRRAAHGCAPPVRPGHTPPKQAPISWDEQQQKQSAAETAAAAPSGEPPSREQQTSHTPPEQVPNPPDEQQQQRQSAAETAAAASDEQPSHEQQTRQGQQAHPSADPARSIDIELAPLPPASHVGGGRKATASSRTTPARWKRKCIMRFKIWPWMIRVGFSVTFLLVGIFVKFDSNTSRIVFIVLGCAGLVAESLPQLVRVCDKTSKPCGILPSYIICYAVATIALVAVFLGPGPARLSGIVFAVFMIIVSACYICSLA